MYRLKATANFNTGGGGGGTVEEVIHDSTLIGKGTSDSPLKVDTSKFASPQSLNSKQDTLVSGTNIKTINGSSILGEGNLVIESGTGGLSSVAHDNTMTGAGTNNSPLGINTSTVALKSDIPDTSDFITKSVNDLTNYTKTSDLGDLATKDKVDYDTDITNKPTIPSEVTETTVSGWGFTKNAGTITGITMNSASKGTSGVVDLGTVITSHQDISGKLDTNKVKNAKSTTAGDVYDVRYINTMLGDIESLLSGV